MTANCVFCMLVIGFVLVADKDTEAAQTAVNMAFVTLATTLTSYVFGAVWDDRTKRLRRKDDTDTGDAGGE